MGVAVAAVWTAGPRLTNDVWVDDDGQGLWTAGWFGNVRFRPEVAR